MVQCFLPGHEQLEVSDDGECYRVNYGFYAFASFAKDDKIALRITVAQLASKNVRKTDLWRCFGVSRNSIGRWMKLYREGGLQALVALKAGAGVKVTDDIKDVYRLASWGTARETPLQADRHRGSGAAFRCQDFA